MQDEANRGRLTRPHPFPAYKFIPYSHPIPHLRLGKVDKDGESPLGE